MKAAQTAKSPNVLVIDVGGTNVKLLATGQNEPRRYPVGSVDDSAEDGASGEEVRLGLEV
jgi:hypothetical protein